MDDQLNSLLLLILGWLLGTLSPAIVDAISAKRASALGRAAIENELYEFSSVLVAACFRTATSAGKVDRNYLTWQKAILEADRDSERAAEFLALTDKLLEFSDAEMAAAAQIRLAADRKSILLQKYAVPLLDYRVSALQAFETHFQRSILVIRRNISLLDSTVDQSREFYRLTFTQQSASNNAVIQDNLKQTYGEYAERSKIIVNQIHKLRGERR